MFDSNFVQNNILFKYKYGGSSSGFDFNDEVTFYRDEVIWKKYLAKRF